MQNWRIELRKRIKNASWNLRYKIIAFVSVIILSYFITRLIGYNRYNFSQYYTLWLTLMALGFWVTEAVPAFAVGIFIIGFQVFTLGNKYFNPQPFDSELFTNTISNPIIWLMLGGFFLAGGMRKTGMDQQLLVKTVRYFGPGPKRLLFGIMLSTMTLSMVMSNTAATAMMIAMLLPFMRTLGDDSGFRKSFMLGVPAAATIGGMGTIIGSPPNAIAAGVLENASQPISFVKWMEYGLLPALTLTILAWWLFTLRFKSEISSVNEKNVRRSKNTIVPSALQQWVVIITLIITIAGWLTVPLHHVPVHLVAMIPVVIFPLAGVIEAEDFNAMNWDTLILVAGGLSLGGGIIDTGLAERLLSDFSIGNISGFWLALLFSYISMALSNIVSNTATAAILVPVAVQLAPEYVVELACSIALASSCALLLPVSTPPNALAYATGFIRQKDLRFGGLVIGLLGPAAIVCWIFLLETLGG